MGIRNWSAYCGSIWSNSTITTRFAGGGACFGPPAEAPAAIPVSESAAATTAAMPIARILVLRICCSRRPGRDAGPLLVRSTVAVARSSVNGCVMHNAAV